MGRGLLVKDAGVIDWIRAAKVETDAFGVYRILLLAKAGLLDGKRSDDALGASICCGS